MISALILVLLCFAAVGLFLWADYLDRRELGFDPYEDRHRVGIDGEDAWR